MGLSQTLLKIRTKITLGLLGMILAVRAQAYTANQVSFQFLSNGKYRVNLYYTVPALKEFRESTVEFNDRAKAEAFYFNVLRGADFYLADEPETRFVNEPLAPSPW
jgi:hypothetical protein